MALAGHWGTDWHQHFLTDFPLPIIEHLQCARLCAKLFSPAHFRAGETGSGREDACLRTHNQEVDEPGTDSAILPRRPQSSPALPERFAVGRRCGQQPAQPRRDRGLQHETLLTPLAPGWHQPHLSVSQDRGRAWLTGWVKAPCLERWREFGQ